MQVTTPEKFILQESDKPTFALAGKFPETLIQKVTELAKKNEKPTEFSVTFTDEKCEIILNDEVFEFTQHLEPFDQFNGGGVVEYYEQDHTKHIWTREGHIRKKLTFEKLDDSVVKKASEHTEKSLIKEKKIEVLEAKPKGRKTTGPTKKIEKKRCCTKTKTIYTSQNRSINNF